MAYHEISERVPWPFAGTRRYSLLSVVGDPSMAKVKIDVEQLQRYLDAGHTQADAARHFGVSEGAIWQRIKKLTGLTSRVVALEKAGEVVDQKLNANARLQRAQQIIDDELAWAVDQAQQPGADRGKLQDTILKLVAEVRQQLGLQLNITRTLVDLKVVREFQRSVTETIAEIDPSVAREIVAKLKARRALRASGSLPALDGRGGFGVA